MVSHQTDNKTAIIVGGGLAGLVCALLLNRAGFAVTLIEKKQYPFHRVCGEYISNETLPFLKNLGCDMDELQPSTISKLAITSISGKLFTGNLDLGGFGISRYRLDQYLYEKALNNGVTFITGNKANAITYRDDQFEVLLDDGRTLNARFAIAAYGKRSNLDKNRSFFYHRSPYIGVKYHIKTDFSNSTVQLDNFPLGYCGTVKIEDDKYCLCYLSRKENLQKWGTIAEMESQVLHQNPVLKHRLLNSDFLYNKPEVINEINFESKTLVENHLLFCGDSAGMISPLCGNGMAIAIHSAKLLCDAIIQHKNANRNLIEKQYTQLWHKHFGKRIMVGRQLQKLFGAKYASEIALLGLLNIKPLSNLLIKNTHGSAF